MTNKSDMREEMQALVENFTAATTRAELGLAELKATAEASGSALQERIDSAKELVADINFVVKRGDTVASRMEESIRASRRTAADPTTETAPARPVVKPSSFRAARSIEDENAAPRPAPKAPATKRALSEEQSQLLKALQGMR